MGIATFYSILEFDVYDIVIYYESEKIYCNLFWSEDVTNSHLAWSVIMFLAKKIEKINLFTSNCNDVEIQSVIGSLNFVNNM